MRNAGPILVVVAGFLLISYPWLLGKKDHRRRVRRLYVLLGCLVSGWAALWVLRNLSVTESGSYTYDLIVSAKSFLGGVSVGVVTALYFLGELFPKAGQAIPPASDHKMCVKEVSEKSGKPFGSDLNI